MKLPAVLLAAAAAATSHIDLTSLLLIIGASVFALASWRRDTRNVLRQQNLDLAERNQTLEGDLVRLKALIDSLNKRPNLDQQAAVLTQLIEKLADHDRAQGERDTQIVAALDGLSKNIHANTTALGFWLGEREQRGLND